MRASFTVLLTTGSLIVIDRLLGLLPDMGYRYFLGIPTEFAKYPSALLYLLFYTSLLAFCSSAYRVLSVRIEVTEPSATKTPSGPAPELVAGIALSSLTSIIFVFALAGANGDIPKQSLIWFLFVVVAGLLINQPSAGAISQTLLYAVWPASTMFVYTVALLLLAYYMKGKFVVSGGETSIDGAALVKFGAVGFVVSLVAFPAIAAASIARDRIFELVRGATNLSPSKLKRLKGNVSAVLAICGLLASAVIGYALPK